MGTYHVQTNLSVQIMQTSIWTTESTSKGYGRLGNFTIKRPSLDWVITLLQISTPTPPAHPLDDDPVVHIEVCIVCTERLVCTRYIPFLDILIYGKVT
jgi:hypothetical protein